jgi:hypothetical protein
MPTKKAKASKSLMTQREKSLTTQRDEFYQKMAQTKMSPTKMSQDKQKISSGKNMPGSTPLKANAYKYKAEANKRASKAIQLMRKKNK